MKLKVILVRSTAGKNPDQRATVRTLGLNKINSSAVHDDTPAIRGMIRKVNHLVAVEEING